MMISSSAWQNPSGKALLALLAFLLFLGSILIEGEKLITLFPLLVSAILTIAIGYTFVPLLKKLKAGQVIREDGPQNHLQKAGTPTMGGIFFVPVALFMALIWSKLSAEVVAVSLLTLSYATIGFVDDWQILAKKSNKGISPRLKLILQILSAIAWSLWLFFTQPSSITNIYLPANIIIPLGLLFFPLAVFVLTAESNATNLTDGIDGLAGGTAAIAALGLAAILAPNSPDLMIFCLCLSGACFGFVWHNHNPATVFMGDTGSLALGGALASVGILSGNLWSLFIISGIFFLESLSVIAQVTYYKATKDADGKGKRLLKMAPLHHHLELSGWTETQIVGVFYLIAAFLSLLAILIT